jgi:hypothetical protein
MLERSAQIIAWCEQALERFPLPPLATAAAIVGSPARAEASPESDADWNLLLNAAHLRWPHQAGSEPAFLDHALAVPAYCLQLADRDRDLRLRVQFDALIRALEEFSRQSPGQRAYSPKPLRDDGAAGERLRAFAERELYRPWPDYPRTGLAAPVLAASAPLDGPGSDPTSWQVFRDRLRQNVEPKLLALAWICQVGEKLHRLAHGTSSADAVQRHAMHGLLASTSQCLLVLQDGLNGYIVPYWRAPLCLSSYPEEVPRLLAQAAILVARSRVEIGIPPPTGAVLELVASLVERALASAGPAGNGWLTQPELEGVLRAFRLALVC